MYIVQHNGGRLILESDNEVPNFLIHFPAMRTCTCVRVFMIGELKEKKLSTRVYLVYVFTIVLVPIDIVHMYPCTVMEEVEGMMGIMFIILMQIITSAIN